MQLIKLLTLIGLSFLISNSANSQIIDNYGVRTGVGISNIYWDFGIYPNWAENRAGFSAFFNAEKKINQFLSLRPEFGFIQKGCDYLIISKNEEEVEIDRSYAKIDLHNISLNIGLKVSYFKTKFNPYLIAGLRGEYLLGNSISYDSEHFHTEVTNFFNGLLSDFNKFSLSGLIGLGCEYNEIIYVDFEFNPALTNNSSNTELKAKSRYYGITLGININKLTKRK